MWRKSMSTFPARHRHAFLGLDSIECPKVAAVEALAQFGLPGYELIVLMGPPGTGKTQLMTCTGFEMNVRLRQGVCYTTAFDLFEDFRTRRDSDGPGGRCAMYRKRVVGGLFIDELNHGHGTPFEQEVLSAVIDSRYREALPTMMATNLTWDAFVKAHGQRVASRITEVGLVINCDWSSYRHPQRP